jgi:hypothetical protein
MTALLGLGFEYFELLFPINHNNVLEPTHSKTSPTPSLLMNPQKEASCNLMCLPLDDQVITFWVPSIYPVPFITLGHWIVKKAEDQIV